ncbi:hypothetical protein [Myceligenerans xiligouense]|uniref:Uncharacterized protein n=1 Tax=Myceligenerans xiligouense TaxID=253184 RepID=A0A3N4ZNJ8_9MICO|nr:hypothetical protein [Myceligenerans xiligouense]RPF21441.1 hypothetical protein EDD34_2069 [Myceligenerans xiligouense]
MLTVEAVLEVPAETDFVLWPTSGIRELTYMRLHGAMTDVEVGSAIRALMEWTYDVYADREASIDRYLETGLAPPSRQDEVRETEGGLRFADPQQGVTIDVGCCAGLDDRESVYNFLDGAPNWSAGHDPSPSGYRADGLVRIVQDETDEASESLVCTEAELRRELVSVETDLVAFVDLVAQWATRHAPAVGEALAAEIARALEIGRYDGRIPQDM